MTTKGLISDPSTLTRLTQSATIIPGDTIFLRAGNYDSDYAFTFNGTTQAPILFKPYPGERATIRGNVSFNGQNLHAYGLEFTGRNIIDRQSIHTGSAQPDDISPNVGGVGLNGEGCKLINCIIHDCNTNGISSMSDIAAEIYGCLVYYNGWDAPDRGHGHAAYIQSDAKTKLIKDCIFHSQFGWGLHAYTEGGHINNIQGVGITGYRSGCLSAIAPAENNLLIGGLSIAQNALLNLCMSYGGGGINFGYNAGTDHGTLTNNYASDGISKVNCTNLTESGNTTGVIGDLVFVRPNDYQSDRANVTIFNESGADTVTVDLTSVSGLSIGDQVKVRNTRDYFVDIQTLTLDADKKIVINMQAVNRTIAIPAGWTAPANTFPTFGCFVLEKL